MLVKLWRWVKGRWARGQRSTVTRSLFNVLGCPLAHHPLMKGRWQKSLTIMRKEKKKKTAPGRYFWVIALFQCFCNFPAILWLFPAGYCLLPAGYWIFCNFVYSQCSIGSNGVPFELENSTVPVLESIAPMQGILIAV